MTNLLSASEWLLVAAGAGGGLLIGLLIAAWIAARLKARVTLAETELKSQLRLEQEREQAFHLASERLSRTFDDLANAQFRSHSETFLKLAKENLGVHQERAKGELAARELAIEGLLRPLRETMQRTEAQLQELDKARRETHGTITAQLQAMSAAHQALSSETRNLVQALRRPEVRGQWGELTLKRLVELAGMVEHCDFQEQVHHAGEDQVIRPDMIVRMPDERELVVDVKTPLDAYLEAVEAADDAQRELGLQRHTRNLREHIRTLSSKAYWAQFSKSPEFVILFIPGDQFLSAALNVDPELIDYALTQQIILATPTSFVALLKAVAYGWRQSQLAENAEEIRVLAQDLYGRLATFVAHMNRVGRQLASSVENYNRAVGSLERSVLPGARKFTELGVQARNRLEKAETIDPVPRTMIESSDDDEGKGSKSGSDPTDKMLQ